MGYLPVSPQERETAAELIESLRGGHLESQGIMLSDFLDRYGPDLLIEEVRLIRERFQQLRAELREERAKRY